MTSRRIVQIAFVCLVSAPGVALAQTPDATAITLTEEDAVARALATSNRVVEAQARTDAAAAVVGERHAPGLLPHQ